MKKESKEQIENCMKRQCDFCSRKYKCDKEIKDEKEIKAFK